MVCLDMGKQEENMKILYFLCFVCKDKSEEKCMLLCLCQLEKLDSRVNNYFGP